MSRLSTFLPRYARSGMMGGLSDRTSVITIEDAIED